MQRNAQRERRQRERGPKTENQITKDRRQKTADRRQETKDIKAHRLGALDRVELEGVAGQFAVIRQREVVELPCSATRHSSSSSEIPFWRARQRDRAWLGKRAGVKDLSKELHLAAHLRTRVDLPPCTPQAETPRQTACHRSNTTKTSLTKPALAMLRRDFTPIKTSARYFVAHPWQPSAPTGSHPSGSIPSQAAAGLLLLLLPSASLE